MDWESAAISCFVAIVLLMIIAIVCISAIGVLLFFGFYDENFIVLICLLASGISFGFVGKAIVDWVC